MRRITLFSDSTDMLILGCFVLGVQLHRQQGLATRHHGFPRSCIVCFHPDQPPAMTSGEKLQEPGPLGSRNADPGKRSVRV
jgi:hypothetical protein